MSDSGHSADPIEAIQAQLVAARRTQILDAATRVFASKGFNRATIRDVAQDAGVADGTIYNYFANKTDLLFGLLDRLNDTERRPASLALAAEASFADYFRAYVRERVEALWSNADLFRAVLPELLANPELRARYFDEVIAPTMALGESAFAGLGRQWDDARPGPPVEHARRGGFVARPDGFAIAWRRDAGGALAGDSRRACRSAASWPPDRSAQEAKTRTDGWVSPDEHGEMKREMK